MIMKRCKICNDWFKQNSNCQKYCSKQCSKRASIDRACHHNKKHPERAADSMRKMHYLRKYGMTISDYNRLFRRQKGCCAICKVHQDKLKRRLAVDHNHKTRKIRGLVCLKCNRHIGRVENILANKGEFNKKIRRYLAKNN